MLAGQKILHHRSDVLETVVLINPSDEAVSTEVNHSEIFHQECCKSSVRLAGCEQVLAVDENVLGVNTINISLPLIFFLVS